MTMTVGIVNDVRTVAESLRRLVSETPGFRVLWTVHSGEVALARHREHPADIVLMDLVMPGMDGVETTAALMAAHPCAVLVVTATVVGNRELVFAAMGKGALDAVNTPDASSKEGAEELRRKLTTVSRLVKSAQRTHHHASHPGRASGTHAAHTKAAHAAPLIAIGASTGGPQAVQSILRALPHPLHAAIVVVQHLDRQFVAGFRAWLAGQTKFPVHVAAEGEQMHAGTVYLAESNHHLVVRKGMGGALRLHYVEEPADTPHRPSVDVFFESMLALHGVARMGVLLTGMGGDGARGLLALREAGVPTMAQDAASSVVYGMPRMALEIGAVQIATALADMPKAIEEFVEANRERSR